MQSFENWPYMPDPNSSATAQQPPDNRPTASGITLHLTPEPVWRGQEGQATYLPEAFGREGFIHCSDGEARVLEAGNRYYQGDPRPYLLLDIDLDRVGAPAVYEDEARCFPHIHGPLEREAVVRVRRVERGADGTFLTVRDDDMRC
jgi:uncharacterized protein (DUF952 family)